MFSLDQMLFEHAYLIFIAVSLGASIVSAVFGFGTAMFVLAAGSLILPVKECIALATILFTGNTLMKSGLYWREINWRLTAIMSLVSLPFAFIGAQIMAVAPVDLLQTLLAVLTLIYVALHLRGPMPHVALSRPLVYGASGLYGFFSGLIGTGNLIKAIFLQRAGFEKQAFVGVMAATSVLANLGKLVSYSHSGILQPGHWKPGLALVAISILSTIAGRSLLRRLSSAHFQRGVLCLLIVLAVALIFR